MDYVVSLKQPLLKDKKQYLHIPCFLHREKHLVIVSMLSFQGSKKKEMVDRLLKHATEMKEIQERYEFSLTSFFLWIWTMIDLYFFPLHRELDQLGYDKLIEMAYEKSKVKLTVPK